MTVPIEIAAVVFGPLVSAGLVGTVSWTAVRISVAKVQQQLLDKIESDNRRFDRVEKIVGISEGNGAAFVRRSECLLVDSSVKERLDDIRGDISAFRLSVDGRIMHLEARVLVAEGRIWGEKTQ